MAVYRNVIFHARPGQYLYNVNLYTPNYDINFFTGIQGINQRSPMAANRDLSLGIMELTSNATTKHAAQTYPEISDNLHI